MVPSVLILLIIIMPIQTLDRLLWSTIYLRHSETKESRKCNSSQTIRCLFLGSLTRDEFRLAHGKRSCTKNWLRKFLPEVVHFYWRAINKTESIIYQVLSSFSRSFETTSAPYIYFILFYNFRCVVCNLNGENRPTFVRFLTFFFRRSQFQAKMRN